MGLPSTFFRFLSSDGTASGTKNANVDGGTPVKFWLAHPTRTLQCVRMLVHVEDSGSFTSATYGAVSTLSNGVLVKHIDAGGTETDLLDGTAITSNSEWGRYCYDAVTFSFSAGGNNTLAVRWTFEKAGRPLTLEPGDKLEVTIQDNLTGLVEHYFMIQGYYSDRRA